MGGKMGTPEERYERYVVRNDKGCWGWTGATCKFGYGILKCEEHSAHRLSWRIHFGPIPKGKCVLHKCDNPPCSRPDHLFLGDRTVNGKDMHTKGRGVYPRGEKHGEAKLTEEAVQDIRRRAGTVTNRQLALEYGVSAVLIGHVIHRKAWRHI